MQQPDGCNTYITPRGIKVIELDYWADEDRGQEWASREKVKYAAEKDWRRENLRDWTSAEGDIFYPEFQELGRERYVFALSELAALPVVRSFDFGFRRPACTWLQYSAKSDRVWWIREFMPHDLGTHDFRDAVQFLSGRLDYSALTPRSRDWVDLYANKEGAPKPPWFSSTIDFFDVSGPESYRTEASAIRATEEANAAQVFANGGIYLNMVDPPVKARVDIIRRLLKLRDDGFPGLIIDPQCEEGIQMFNGALSFERQTKDNPIPSKPRKDGHFENLHDAFGYGVVSVVPMEDRQPGVPADVVIGYNGREPIYKPIGDDLGWYESRGPHKRRRR
jgi:hypothetical protein